MRDSIAMKQDNAAMKTIAAQFGLSSGNVCLGLFGTNFNLSKDGPGQVWLVSENFSLLADHYPPYGSDYSGLEVSWRCAGISCVGG
ncbi:hypothetical protein BDW60DRAFT_189326 [Aspergillus nidulans var. acristatus]